MDDLEDYCEIEPQVQVTTDGPPQAKRKLSRLHRMNVSRPVDQPAELRRKAAGPSVAAVIQDLQAKDLQDLGPEDSDPSPSGAAGHDQSKQDASIDKAVVAGDTAGPIEPCTSLDAEPYTAAAAPCPSQHAEAQVMASALSPPVPAENPGTGVRKAAKGSSTERPGPSEQSSPSKAASVDAQKEAAKGSIDAYLGQHGVDANAGTQQDQSLHDLDLEINSDSDGGDQQQQQRSGQVDEDEGKSRGSGYWDEEDELEDMLKKEVDESDDDEVNVRRKTHGRARSSSQDSGAASRGADDDDEDILAQSPGKLAAATQRVLREAAVRDIIGKGFQPEAKPVSSLLQKLQSRQAALLASAKQRMPPPPSPPKPAVDLEQFKALMEEKQRHMQEQKRQQRKQQQQQQLQSQRGAAVAGAGDPLDIFMTDGAGELSLDLDEDGDDLEIVAQSQAEADKRSTSPGETAAADGDEDEGDLSLELEEDEEGSDAEGEEECLENEIEGEQDAAAGAAAGATAAADSNDQSKETAEQENEEADEDEMDASEQGEEAEGEEEEASEDGAKDPDLEEEPLHFEEEEEAIAGTLDDNPDETAAAADAGQAERGKQQQRAKKKAKQRERLAGGGFVEAEAELSDEEGMELDDEDDDEEEGADGNLADLLGTVKENKFDELARVDLHQAWEQQADAAMLRQLLHGVQHGFKRNRNQGEDADDEDDSDAAARRRRAQLLGTLDDEEEDQQQQDKQWQLDFQYDDGQITEEVQEAMFKEAEAHHRRLLESQTEDGPVLLPIDQDEDSQDVAALLSRSQSASHAGGGAAVAAAAATKEADALAALAKSSLGAFRFTMFGRDVTNSQEQQQQATFLGRQTSGAAHIRGTSNLGTSRSFVFGSDPNASNHSNFPEASASAAGGVAAAPKDSTLGLGHGPSRFKPPAAPGAPGQGPATFAGLGKMIAASSSQGQVGAPSLFSLLKQGNKEPQKAAGSTFAKQHLQAVNAKFKKQSIAK